MKLDKFHEICEQIWEDHRGDVQELHLREDSFDELWKDILLSRTRPMSILNASVVLHPITRSEVRIRITKGMKDFVVAYYKAGMKKRVDLDELQRS